MGHLRHLYEVRMNSGENEACKSFRFLPGYSFHRLRHCERTAGMLGFGKLKSQVTHLQNASVTLVVRLVSSFQHRELFSTVRQFRA